ncbi:hypothetical protein JTB14_024741 [Gonioctena quinquepunctata]|nr:hypothetical protein JTB14_024741 [Gonioctena quinquepunctata]
MRQLKEKLSLSSYKTFSSWDNYVQCNKTHAETKKLFKSKARSHWRKWVSELNRNTPSQHLWKQAKLIQIIKVNTKKSINNGWQEEFLDNIAPSYVPKMMTIPQSEIDEPSSFLGQPFTLRELELAIKKSSDTAPGFDDITYSMISHLPVVAKIYLLDIFNDIWVRNADCQYWKTVNVIPILKMDKCPNSASSYRPISLFSCLFKTFERMIKARLEWHLKMFNILPTYQFGFKTGYGTLDAVATLVTDIQASLTKNN